jgi:hypothetical protein
VRQEEERKVSQAAPRRLLQHVHALPLKRNLLALKVILGRRAPAVITSNLSEQAEESQASA